MRNSGRRNEAQGQSLVLVALAAVVLFAFVGLAIDGGMVYSQRRIAQNAADGGAIAGSFELQDHSRTTPGLQGMILEKINQAAEAHGLPDTDGNPGNEVNANLEAFFTDNHGNAIEPQCQIFVSCTTIPEDAWGVKVRVTLPFDTFFAGVIGLPRLAAGADSVAVVHEGARALDRRYWAVFATERHACPANNAQELTLSGAYTEVVGNMHTNADFGRHIQAISTGGQLTYVGDCESCGGWGEQEPQQTDRLNLVFPSYTQFRDLAETEGNDHGSLTLYDGEQLGNPVAFNDIINYINGDLNVSGNNVLMYGLIFVTGNVTISGDNLGGEFTLVTDGVITVDQDSEGFQGRPFEEQLFGTYPILAAGTNVTTFYSNLQRSPDQLCDEPVINIEGDNNPILGAILAPHGHIAINGENVSVQGTVIGNTVDVRGEFSRIEFDEHYFPPQPNRIELME